MSKNKPRWRMEGGQWVAHAIVRDAGGHPLPVVYTWSGTLAELTRYEAALAPQWKVE